MSSFGIKIIVHGLLAVAPEKEKAQCEELMSKMRKLISEYPKEVSILSMMKVHLDMSDMADAELKKMAEKMH